MRGAATSTTGCMQAERPELFFKATGRRVVGHGGGGADAVRCEVVGAGAGVDAGDRSRGGDHGVHGRERYELARYRGRESAAICHRRRCMTGAARWGRASCSQEKPLGSRRRGFILRLSAPARRRSLRARRWPSSSAIRGSWLHFLYRDNSFPQGAFLMTGTGIVPPDDFTLADGDRIRDFDRWDRDAGKLGGVKRLGAVLQADGEGCTGGRGGRWASIASNIPFQAFFFLAISGRLLLRMQAAKCSASRRELEWNFTGAEDIDLLTVGATMQVQTVVVEGGFKLEIALLSLTRKKPGPSCP